jgi:hypothetical protein
VRRDPEPPRQPITGQTLITHASVIIQAIMGGTGRYVGAEGEIHIDGLSSTTERWTFRLVDER